MKKTVLLKSLAVAALIVTASSVFVACDSDYWDPYPPSGWDTNFWDSRLDGYWQLIQINSQPVSNADTNWLFFNGSGRGIYYYYFNGQRYSELTAYWCQPSVSGQTRYQLNLEYQSTSTPTTINYWFEGTDVLWMQWRNQSGIQTYIYRYYGRAPW
ncbi:MAG: hypothetical protein NC548_31550 [Lachnospiraceae bacterium]|nr:hypothetical protein [Lachnospiraceae bacterium]